MVIYCNKPTDAYGLVKGYRICIVDMFYIGMLLAYNNTTPNEFFLSFSFFFRGGFWGRILVCKENVNHFRRSGFLYSTVKVHDLLRFLQINNKTGGKEKKGNTKKRKPTRNPFFFGFWETKCRNSFFPPFFPLPLFFSNYPKHLECKALSFYPMVQLGASV